MKKSGFTLIELMVYVAIVGIVVLVAGQAFSDSTKFRIRTQEMLKAGEMAGATADLLKEDIAQIGAKNAKNSSAANGLDQFLFQSAVYYDADNTDVTKRDSSSFSIERDDDGVNVKKLVMNRMRYNADDSYAAVEQVTWTLENGVLYRKCQTLDAATGADLTDCPKTNSANIQVASNVDTFLVIPAKPNVRGDSIGRSMFPNSDASIKNFRLIARYGVDELMNLTISPSPSEDASNSVTLTGFTSNYDFSNNVPITDGKRANQVYAAVADETSGNWSYCKKMAFIPGHEYELSFNLGFKEDNSRLFCPGRDFLSVGLRNQEGKKISSVDDFVFYPPTTVDAPVRRAMRFMVNKGDTACIAFTFANYSPVVRDGSLQISDLKLVQVDESVYDFNDELYSPSIAEKKKIRAFKIKLVVKSKNETGFADVVVPTPSNGSRG